MTIERGIRPTSPIHVHVDDDTPVHVHVKKNPKSFKEASKTSDLKGSGNVKSSATARSRSKSPGSTPWIPAPAKSSKASKLAWQGASHRLEINCPEKGVQIDDFNTEEDKRKLETQKYEKKIDGLMNEVGSLKSEMELQRTLREMDRKDELLDTSRRILEDQEEEIKNYQRELEATDMKNLMLRKSVEALRNENSFERHTMNCEKDDLMRKLVEVEMDGQSASKQVAALKDYIQRLKEENQLTSSDALMLTKHKNLLLDRLAEFENTNRNLRSMLRDRHIRENDINVISDQRDLLLRKLSEAEDKMQRAQGDLLAKDRELADLKISIEAQRDENIVISGLQSSLESTRAHLQKQLRQKEADCNRMAVQIRTLESNIAKERIEVDHVQELLTHAKEKADKDKEALKKAARVQKQRASRTEDAIELKNVQIMEKDALISELRLEIENAKSNSDKSFKEKAQGNIEIVTLKTRISELEKVVDNFEDSNRIKAECANSKIAEKSSENSALKIENERLKSTISLIEKKLIETDSEVSQLRANLRQFEKLVEEYRMQIAKSQHENNSLTHKLEEKNRETSLLQRENEIEFEKNQSILKRRLSELAPFPERLREAELKLKEATEKINSYKKLDIVHQEKVINLSAKAQSQQEQKDQVINQWQEVQEVNRSMTSQIDSMERRVRDLEEKNRDLLREMAKREETVHQTNLRLEDKSRENGVISRQLENALADARRLSEQARLKCDAKDKATQSRILELESQLSQIRGELTRIKREKEDAERKFNSRLYDLKDRLDQSHSTNRSLQNYVQFLKNSYANVFGDSSMVTSSPIHPTYR